MQILFLSQRVPFPPDRGDKITTCNILRHLAQHHEVSAVCFLEEEREQEAVRSLEEMGVRVHTAALHAGRRRAASLPWLLTPRALTLPYFSSRTLRRAVAAEVEGGADLLLAYSSSMGQYMLPYADLPKIQIFAELDSDKWRQYARNHRAPASWIYAREHRTLLRFERKLAQAVNFATVVSQVEKDLFLEQIPGAPVEILPNGVDLETFRPGPFEERDGQTVLFTGVMDYGANVDGVLWFCERIWPAVRAEFPAARFLIVGARPSAEIRRLDGSEGIAVSGFVDSTVPYFDRSAVAVAPLRIARGIQNKVLEAMACGLPVVATTSAFSGIAARPGRDLLVEDEPAAFAAALVGLLRAPQLRRDLGASARALVEQRYRWEEILATLDELIARASTQKRR